MFKSIFNFVFIWLLFLSTLGFTVHQIQKPNFLTRQAKEIDFYERVTSNASSFFPKEAKEKMPFTDTELESLVTATVDRDTFYGFLDTATPPYLEYLTKRSEKVEFSYSLAPIKIKFADALTAKMIEKYGTLPVCKSNQLKSWQATDGLPSCQLGANDSRSSSVNALFARQATEVAKEWPDNFNVTSPPPGLEQPREVFGHVMKSISIIWLVTLVFLLLYLLVFRSRAFLSLAAIFILSGLLELGFSLIGWKYVGNAIAGILNAPGENLAGFTADMTGAVAEILKEIMSSLSIVSLVAGATFLVVGVISRFHAGVKAITPEK